MFGIGMQELMIILLVALVVIGPKKLPEVARSIAKGVRELRKASDDLKATIMVDMDEPYRPQRYEPPPPRELPARTGTAIKKAEPFAGDGEPSEDGDDDPPSPAIAGSAAFGEEGTVARGDGPSEGPLERSESGPEEGPDPMDAEDHSGMPYGPDSEELKELLAQAKARKAATDGAAEEPESA